MEYSKARYHILTGGSSSRHRPATYFIRKEEQILVDFLRVSAIIRRGLSREAFLRLCRQYISGI